MTIVLHTAELASATASSASRADKPRSNQRVGTMTLKWLLPTRTQTKQLRVRLPGAGTVRVDVDKHVEKALKGKANESAGRNQPSGKATRD